MQAKILLVDDEVDLLEELKWELEARYYKVYTATSGKEALIILSDTEIDILLTDIRMPEISGVDLIRKAKELYPNLQCIILTGYGDMKTAIVAMRYGAINFLCKPRDVEGNVLEAAIKEALEKLKLIRSVQEKQMRLEEANRKIAKMRDKMKEILESQTKELRIVKLREQLVRVMNLSLQYYKLATGKTKIELADESGIWGLTEYDNGFAPRTMNKYLRIDTIPKKNPRYKDVQSTGYFVLFQEPIYPHPDVKNQLKEALEQLESLISEPALDSINH